MQNEATCHRKNWPFVLGLVFLLGACSPAGRVMTAGVRQDRTAPPLSDACDHSASANPGADMEFGPGPSLEFYKMFFGPRDTSIGVATACFAPGTDEHVMAYVNEQELIDPIERYQLSGRWSGAQGTPRALTWSFVPDGLIISGGVGEAATASDLFARLDSLFAAQGGRATWINRFQLCFDRWSQLCGVTYTRITVGGNDWDDNAVWGSSGAAGLRGDIRLSMHNIDGGSGILAYNYFPANGDMVLDRSESWGSSSNVNRFLRNTIMHEHGHGLGISHVCPVSGTKLMEPFLNTGFDGLRLDEIRAGQRHYGDPSESNDSAGAATNIGTLVIGTPITKGTPLPNPPAGTSPTNSSTLSIDANAKTDFFKFHVDSAMQARVTVTPQGLTYLSGPQNGDGSCSAGTSVNSLAIADLAVDIIGTDGVTVLGTANATAAGSAETLSNVALSGTGDYYMKVYEANSPTESQLYTFTLSACTTITVDPPSLPGATVGQFYNQALSASGGTGPYTFAVTSGSLPAGLTLSFGTLSGTPTGPAGTANFTITTTDTANSCTGNRAYALNVACPTVSLAPPSLSAATIGQPYNQAITASGANGSFTFAVTAGNLPPQIALSSGGNLTGTPASQVGTFNFTVTATDTSGCTGSQAYSISVACGLLGDSNNDGVVDGLDVQSQVNCLLGLAGPADYCGCADMGANGAVDDSDTPPFVDALVP